MKTYLWGLLLLMPSLAMANQVDGRFIKDGSITSGKLSSSAVTSSAIAADSVDDTKIRLRNDNYLRSRNFAGSGDINMLKVDTSDRMLFFTFPHTPSSAPVDQYDVANKKYVDDHTSSSTWLHEILTLSASDVTNQYKDSSQYCNTNSVMAHVVGLLGSIGTDYNISIVANKTRISLVPTVGWGTGSQQALILNDAIDLQCQY